MRGQNCNLISTARCFLRAGFSVVPVAPNSKKPAIPWKELSFKYLHTELVEHTFNHNSNIAIVTGKISGITVVDVDEPDQFNKFYNFDELMEYASVVVKTARGYHFWFKYDPEIKTMQRQELGFDIKNDHALVLTPPSKINEHQYSFMKSEELKTIPEDFKRKILSLQNPKFLSSAKTGRVVNLNVPLDEFLKHFEVKKIWTNNGIEVFRAICPAHDDTEPSLDIWQEGNEIKLKCWAGCKKEDILRAVGLEEKEKEDRERINCAKKLLELMQGFELWLNQNNEEFITILCNGSNKNLKIASSEFRKLLQGIALRAGILAYPTAISMAVEHLAGLAQLNQKKYNTYIRIGESCDFKELYLGNNQVVRIWKDKIEIGAPKLKFVEPVGFLLLPEPDLNADSNSWYFLKRIINTSEENLILCLAWLVNLFKLQNEQPILNVTGEREGLGKTSVSKILKCLIDPTLTPIKPLPHDEVDILCLSLSNLVLAFDNISHITSSMSDCLCRISTGSALARRRLYTDNEVVQYFVKNPIILNGISLIAERRDLRRRMLTIELLQPERIIPQYVLEKEFKQIQPLLLGWLIRAVQETLNEFEDEDYDLTDLASFVQNVGKIKNFPVSGVQFSELLKNNREKATLEVVFDDPVISLIIEQLKDRDSWEISATNFLEKLHEKHSKNQFQLKQLPKTPNALGRKIRSYLTDLETLGIKTQFSRNENFRLFCFKKLPNFLSVLSSCHFSNKINNFLHDDSMSTNVSMTTNVVSLTTNDNNLTTADNNNQSLVSHNSLKNKENSNPDDTDNKKNNFLKQKENEEEDFEIW
ncbi:bifunctional DNA primase/polymerase [Thermodesulfovibrio sp. TK110]